jgi:hypothetical protein
MSQAYASSLTTSGCLFSGAPNFIFKSQLAHLPTYTIYERSVQKELWDYVFISHSLHRPHKNSVKKFTQLSVKRRKCSVYFRC